MDVSTIAATLKQAMSIEYNTIVYELQKQQKQVTVMSLGEAFFDIPLLPTDVLPNPAIFHYSNSRGNIELRKKITDFFHDKYETSINYEKEILITVGSKAAIYLTLMAIINPGDEVIMQEPFWVSYPDQVSLCHGVPVSIPYYKSVYHFEDYISDKTKVIIINNPNNPSGYVYSEEEICHLLKLAQKYDLLIFCDEAYSEFTDNEPFVSIGTLDKEKKYSVIFNSISKNYGLSGWRLGYVIAHQKLIDNILKIQQHIITCPAVILELYVAEYFYDLLKITEPQIKLLMEKRKIVSNFMNQIGLSALPGKATFYFFISIYPSQLTSEEFCIKLLNEHLISTVPGIGYGNSCDKFIRISIGTASLDEIKNGLIIIKKQILETSHFSLLKNNNVLVVGGGMWQVPLISFLKNNSYTVLVADPYDSAPGVKLADKHIKADVRDFNVIADLIKNEPIAFIASDQTDIAVNTVARLNDYLNLHGNKFEITHLFVDKYEMRKFAEKMGICIPKYEKVSTVNDIISFIMDIKLPVILKPADSQASRGIIKIDHMDFDIIESAMYQCFKHTKLDYILAEEFIEGEEVTVEGLASNFHHRTLAISLKKHFRTAIASELRYPAHIPENMYQQIEQINDYFVESSGLSFGMTHAEYLINRKTGQITLIEIACRGGGSLISSDIVPWVSGVDIYSIYLKNLKGEPSNVHDFEIKKRSAILKFFEFSSGTVKSILGIEEAKKIEGVHKMNLSFKPGDEIVSAEDDRSRQGFFIAFAEDSKRLDEIIAQVHNTVKVTYE